MSECVDFVSSSILKSSTKSLLFGARDPREVFRLTAIVIHYISFRWHFALLLQNIERKCQINSETENFPLNRITYNCIKYFLNNYRLQTKRSFCSYYCVFSILLHFILHSIILNIVLVFDLF